MIRYQEPTKVERGGKYLTFALGAEEYGLPIMKVREIIGYVEVTPLPRTAAHVHGVMNLRGQVMSVVDLRIKLGMPPVPRTDHTCIIVVEVAGREGPKLSVGVIVDRVSEVLWIGTDRVEPTPSFDASVRNDFLLGIAKIGPSIKILLDIDRVLAGAESDIADVRAA